MDLRQLEHIGYRELSYFIAVAEELHFARAAERVGINQSPLSKAITNMERGLGVRLFVRTRRSTEMTQFGEALLPEAKRILAEAARVRTNIAVAAAGHQARLHVAVSQQAASPWIAGLLKASRVQDPSILFTITERRISQQLDELSADLIDVGLVSSLSELRIEADDDIEAIPLGSEPMVLALSADSGLAAREKIASLDAGMGTFVTLGERASDAAPILRLIYRAPEFEARVAFVESVEMLWTLVGAGHGVGLVGGSLAATVSRKDVVFRPIGLKRARVWTYLLVRRERSAVVEKFVERARRLRRVPDTAFV